MKTAVITIDPKNIDSAKLKPVVKALDRGALVAFPTETVYGIAARAKADTLERLDRLKSRTPDKFYTLHISSKSDIGLYVPQPPPQAAKLIKTALPGPLTMVFQLTDEQIALQQKKLGKEISNCLYKENSIGIRCPDNKTPLALLAGTKYPILATSANQTGSPPPTSARPVIEQFGDQLDIVVDAGSCKYKKPSTVVKIEKNKIQVLRTGVYTVDDIKQMAKVKFLFVCTGNTCRSPMAEGIFKKFLAEKIDCKIDFLEDLGYKVLSAGVMGLVGVVASSQAVVACGNKGIDISGHKSRALTPNLIDEADYIFTMSKEHRKCILAMAPQAADKTYLLAGNKNVADPISQPQGIYDKCANQIELSVREIICRLSI